VESPEGKNPGGVRHVVLDVRAINEAHIAEPGLAVVEIAAADTATALAVQAALAGRWATAVADRTHREPGVQLTCHLDVRQEPHP
jgi:hypothetical protein